MLANADELTRGDALAANARAVSPKDPPTRVDDGSADVHTRAVVVDTNATDDDDEESGVNARASARARARAFMDIMTRRTMRSPDSRTVDYECD